MWLPKPKPKRKPKPKPIFHDYARLLTGFNRFFLSDRHMTSTNHLMNSIAAFVLQSQMAQLFLGKTGLIICYVILTVYLFGDLAIYSATVPKSFMSVLW